MLLGAVMDELSMLLLTIPIFFPMVMGLDFGMPKESVAIWFGIMVLMTVGFGLIAPPVGLNVYIVNGMAKGVPMGETYRGVMPFLVSDVLRTDAVPVLPDHPALAGELHALGRSASAASGGDQAQLVRGDVQAHRRAVAPADAAAAMRLLGDDAALPPTRTS